MVKYTTESAQDQEASFSVVESDTNVIIETSASMNQITTRFICIIATLSCLLLFILNIKRFEGQAGFIAAGSLIFILSIIGYIFYKAEAPSTVVKMDSNGIEIRVDKGTFRGFVNSNWDQVDSINIFTPGGKGVLSTNSTFITIQNGKMTSDTVRLFLAGFFQIHRLKDPSSPVSLYASTLEKYATKFSNRSFVKSISLMGFKIQATQE